MACTKYINEGRTRELGEIFSCVNLPGKMVILEYNHQLQWRGPRRAHHHQLHNKRRETREDGY